MVHGCRKISRRLDAAAHRRRVVFLVPSPRFPLIAHTRIHANVAAALQLLPAKILSIAEIFLPLAALLCDLAGYK
jgi:diadenosine tetraphosphatase ApaH/serine/threonine PP2A family protein phosphatase